jgi:two-component response regulator (ARR-A family)
MAAAAAAAAPSPAPSPSPSPAPSPKAVASPKAAAGDRKLALTAADVAVELEEEKHVLAVDDSSVDRAVIAKILRSSKYRGK